MFVKAILVRTVNNTQWREAIGIFTTNPKHPTRIILENGMDLIDAILDIKILDCFGTVSLCK